MIRLLDTFLEHIIDPETAHFKLFFDEKWNSKSMNVSFGHDIEGSWLLCETVDVIADDDRLNRIRQWALRVAEVTAAEGTSKDHGIYYG
ncbi:MAG: hypothetical protein U5R06_03305 [candidate division KSB1 bacterium]|nr:hypothetical protein [candidate division KSB1 bacterium]